MGFLTATGPCVACRRIFAFNPERVPSVSINGSREPVCADCMAEINAERVRRGLLPHSILPGAYEAQEVDG